MTLDTLNAEGKTPAEKDLLIKVEMGSEISRLSSLRTLTGMLLGPEDFEVENEPITLVISSGVVGAKKMEWGFGILKNLEKWLWLGGNLDLMVSAMDIKKSLKWLVTVSVFVVTLFPTEIDILGAVLKVLEEIISRMPLQTFCIFLEFLLKYLVKWLYLPRLVKVTIEFL